MDLFGGTGEMALCLRVSIAFAVDWKFCSSLQDQCFIGFLHLEYFHKPPALHRHPHVHIPTQTHIYT